MTVIDCEQGSREWHEARLGIPTASEFSRIVTPRGAMSASRRKYMGQLLAEWVTGEPWDDLSARGEFANRWIDRGMRLEPEARAAYGLLRDADVETVGLCVRPMLMAGLASEIGVGASPDGLVGAGLLELKCPSPATHIMWLAEGELPREHRMQLQGQLWVTGREWVDFLSYCPQLPPVLHRVAPDPKLQAALDDALPAFVAELAALRQSLLDQGVHPQDPREHERMMDEYERSEADRLAASGEGAAPTGQPAAAPYPTGRVEWS